MSWVSRSSARPSARRARRWQSASTARSGPSTLPPPRRPAMRPEDVLVTASVGRPSVPVPIDVELEALDVELRSAGERARRMLNGQRQPTRYFSLELRQELLDSLAQDAGSISRR